MQISDLGHEDRHTIEQAAALLVEGFRADWPEAWPTHEVALVEVYEALEDGKICRAARDDDGMLLGWIGAQPTYSLVWELHPLVVQPNLQRCGIGRALVADLETQVRQRGAHTLVLGSDDETGMTSLSGVDLYPDVWPHIAAIQNLRGHPFTFYQRCGFVITGVVPDANGFGKPDILMAKRVG
ncbi:MAG: GNAT family N-acetyltransferase [Roseiflexaceae bacterium]|nr:GNAT family N-acetyltransferase [Roseiflexaceae bacterium]